MTALLIRLVGLVFPLAFAAFVLLAAYALLAYFPVELYAEAECLRNGYPKAQVSIGLERYCTTLDGLVSVKVIKP